MRISLYNVEFGDSTLIVGENQNLLIDMGSDARNFDFKPIWEDIYSECKEKDLLVMCSHFHDDHINGVIKHNSSQKKISEIIVPDFLTINTSKGFSFVELSIYQDFFESIMINKTLKLSIYDLLKFLCENNTKVKFVQAGNKFIYDGNEYRVLWPNPYKIELINETDLDTINEIKDSIIEKEIDNMNVNLSFDLLEDGLGRFIKKIAKNIENSFSRWANTNGDINQFEREQIQAIGTDLEELGRLANAVNLIRTTNMKRFVEKFKRKQNELSIVFHNDENKTGNNILFTGDITRNIINKYIYKSLYREYSVIKAPHHGTETHFTCMLPLSENILVSNGNTLHHSTYGKISLKYGCYYNAFQEPKYKIICTNNSRCELKDTNKECKYTHICGFKLKQDIVI